jgi:hypothetical protein
MALSCGLRSGETFTGGDASRKMNNTDYFDLK